MAAPTGNINAKGNSGGKSLQDRKLAVKVRSLALGEIAALLELPKVKMSADEYELYKAILIKLAGTILPRLNEHSGEDGGAIKLYMWGGYSGEMKDDNPPPAEEIQKQPDQETNEENLNK